MKSGRFAAVALIGVVLGASAGCAARTEVSGEVAAPVVFTDEPTLVWVDGDLWVVRDYGFPVYYVGDYYWVERDNVWYRSRSYDRGWAIVDVAVVPAVVVHRDHNLYVHYRGDANARTRVAPRAALASEPRQGPPEHAAAQHGGPPGHDATPGIGRERRVEERPPAPSRGPDRPPRHEEKRR